MSIPVLEGCINVDTEKNNERILWRDLNSQYILLYTWHGVFSTPSQISTVWHSFTDVSCVLSIERVCEVVVHLPSLPSSSQHTHAALFLLGFHLIFLHY